MSSIRCSTSLTLEGVEVRVASRVLGSVVLVIADGESPCSTIVADEASLRSLIAACESALPLAVAS